MKRPLLFAELCAGTAAVSLKLQGGRHARPPVSRMGAKTGYGEAILKVMGLRCGLGAERYLWCDPDPGVRLLLEAYRDHDLALKAAEIIRGWKDEEPRALWERLKAEGPVKAPEPREVARSLYLGQASVRRGDPSSGYDDEPARYERGTRNRPRHPAAVVGDRMSAPTLPADIHPDATQIDPREVARWLTAGHLSYRQMEPDSGFNPGMARDSASPCWRPTLGAVADGLARQPLPAFILPAAVYPMPRFPEDERVIAYMDRRLLDVRPVAALPDGVDGDPCYTVLSCKLLGAERGRPDVADGLSVEDGLGVGLAPLSGAVGDLVGHVGRLGAPCEICGAVIVSGAVKVANHPPVRPGTMEGFADEGRDPAVDTAPASTHDELSVSVFVNPPFQGSIGVDGSDLSIRGHLVFRGFKTLSPLGSHVAPPIIPTIPYTPSTFDQNKGRVVVFIDPPYQGTTGYGHDLPRTEVVRLARAWADAGADVYISEAEPIGALVEDGWHVVEITDTRKGQKRTFGGTQEWLTCSREPAWTPGATRQAHLFGVPEPDTGRR